jgi:serine/threonine-protein kinase
MAVVFLADDLRHRRRVAVKVLRPELAQAVGAQRFLREIEIAAQLSHPHILPLYDSGEAAGFLYYVMPYVEGESLRARLDREKQLSLEDAVETALEVADALSYAHSLGVVHRDIKPENILFQAGHAVVSDFGIARAVSASAGEKLTETGLAVGTPAYMSPEQATASDEVDARTDIYALGCVLYEMLAGDLPFSGATPQAMLARKVVEPVPRLRVVRDTVPVPLEEVITRALAKVPADRFATAAQLRGALDRARAAPSIATARPQVRHRAAAVGALLVVLLAAVGWWLSGTIGGGTPRLHSIAVLPFENLTGDAEQEYVLAGLHDALIGELARLGPLQVRSRRSVVRYAMSDKPVTEIAHELNVDGVVAASFSRSGDSVEVRVQLLQAQPEERSLWAEVYDRDIGEALGMHSEVAGQIARQIGISLTPEQAARLGGPRRVNREAYEAYLRGRSAITRGTPEDVQRGLAYLHEANARDPADPFPYVGLALGYSILGHGPRPEVLPRALAAAERALELDSTLAEPYAVIAQAKFYREWDWAGAAQNFRRALELDPTLADARAHYAWYFDLLGPHDRALAEMRRAIESDPLDPLWHTWLAAMYMYRGRLDEAIAEARNALELNPDFPIALGTLGEGLAYQGKYEEAVAAGERAAALSPQQRGGLAQIYALAGRTDDARRLAAELESEGPAGLILWDLPQAYAALGDKERALAWVERLFDRPHPYAPHITRAPGFVSLRDDPRFRVLVRQLNLPR